MGHHDLAIAATSQSLMGSRLGAPGAIESGMLIAGSQSSQAGLHLGSIGATSGGATGDSGGTGSTVSSQFNQQQANGQHKRGIQTSPDGKHLFLFLFRNLFYLSARDICLLNGFFKLRSLIIKIF